MANPLSMTLVFLISSITLASSYAWLSPWLGPMISAAMVHSLIGIMILAWHHKKSHDFAWLNPKKAKLSAYIPSAAILCGALSLAWLSSAASASHQTPRLLDFAVICLWVPLVEELVFRFGIGSWLKQRAPGWSGLLLSAMFFSFMHSLPTMERLWNLQAGLVLGPLLLGICCELLYKHNRHIMPAIAFHSACNGTGMVFGYLDPRWLEWLQPLYLTP